MYTAQWFGGECFKLTGVNTKKVLIDCEQGAQISILANKIATQWRPNTIITESKQTIYNIYFLFSRYYVYIKMLIWSKNWNCV